MRDVNSLLLEAVETDPTGKLLEGYLGDLVAAQYDLAFDYDYA
jgi:hypothetical protein